MRKLLIAVLLIAMLISVFTPGSRRLLHVVAVGVAMALAGCLWIMLKSPGEGFVYACFFALWMVYYAITVFT